MRLLQIAFIGLAALVLSGCETVNTGSGNNATASSTAAPTLDSRNINNVVSALKTLGSAKNDSEFDSPTITAEARSITYFVDFKSCSSKTNCANMVFNTFWEPSELGRSSFKASDAAAWMAKNPGGKLSVDFEGDLLLEVAASTRENDSAANIRALAQRFLTLARKVEADFGDNAVSRAPLPAFAKVERKADR